MWWKDMVRKHTLRFLFLTFPYFLASPFLILLLPQNGNTIYSSSFSLFLISLLPLSSSFSSPRSSFAFWVSSSLSTLFCNFSFIHLPHLFWFFSSSFFCFFFSLFFVGTASADFLIHLFPPACLFPSSNCPSLISFFVLSLTLSPSPLLW